MRQLPCFLEISIEKYTYLYAGMQNRDLMIISAYPRYFKHTNPRQQKIIVNNDLINDRYIYFWIK